MSFHAVLKVYGLVRDLNPGPLAPKARIIPLDQRAMLFPDDCYLEKVKLQKLNCKNFLDDAIDLLKMIRHCVQVCTHKFSGGGMQNNFFFRKEFFATQVETI